MSTENLQRYAWLSIFAAILTISLKASAYYFTGSVGLLSDALESLINLAAAIVALWMLKISAQPADEDHAFGHDKAEYFSSGIEGTLIFLAAVSIIYAAGSRLLAPQSIEQVGIGLAVSGIATIVNLLVARVLLKAGRKNHSLVLEADGHHLMTDVWTSIGVAVAVGLVSLTGWFILDPIIAILVALNITWTGYDLIKRSALGLMDTVVDPTVQDEAKRILQLFAERKGIEYRNFRSRQSGTKRYFYVDILAPNEWSIDRGHDLLDEIEDEIYGKIENSIVFTHLEPLEIKTERVGKAATQ